MRQQYLFISLVALISSGCVAKSTYTALNQDLQMCQEKVSSMEQAKEGLESELTQVAADRQALASKTQALESKTKEYEEMVGSLQGEIQAGNVKISQLRDRLTVNLVDKVLFDSGSVKIKPAGEEALKKISEVIKNYPDKRILIEGHTDNVPVSGSLKTRFATNWELSATRATTVARLLADEGVTPERLGAAGYGEFRPVAPNDTPEGRQQNRRIEISLLKPQFEKQTMPTPEVQPNKQ